MDFAALARRLASLTGRRRNAAALLLGAAATAILPPLHWLPFGFVAFAGLAWMIDGKTPRAAFVVGWLFGLGHFSTGLYWIANALLIEWQRVGWMIPFAVLGLGALLGVFTGAAAASTRAFRIGGAALPAGLALFWGLGEFARGHVLTGFPWNLTATAWLASDAIAQNAAWFGAYGFSALSVFVFALPASLARRDWRGPVAAAVLVALAWAAGAWRLPPGDVAPLPDVRLRLVQPAVPQALKWDPEARERNLEALIELTRAEGFETRTHVIWSETATAFPVWGDLPALAARRAQIAAAVPPGGVLVTGAPRFARDATGDIQVWNSLHAIEPGGDIDATYDKFHLVPFGEYVPLREILPIDRVVPGGMDFSAGPGPRTLAIRGLPPASPLICYEIIFPGRVVEPGARPGVLINITNDSWFGDSAGPYQHFAAARMRAIEEGLPLIRSAGGGISAVLDPFGRPVAILGLGKRGFVDAGLPGAAAPTAAARWGDLPFAILLAVFAAIARLARRRDS